MRPRTICLHGPESTGKSTMSPRLSKHFDGVCIAEFGRTYCETFGTDLTMADLVTIAKAHDAKTRAAVAAGNYPVVLDTDPLMTEVWAEMLFGRADPWFRGLDRHRRHLSAVRHRPAVGGRRDAFLRNDGAAQTLLRPEPRGAGATRSAVGDGARTG